MSRELLLTSLMRFVYNNPKRSRFKAWQQRKPMQ